MNWYYDIEGRSNGPVTESSLKRLAREGEISGGTLVWHPGLEVWEPLAKLQPELAGKFPQVPEPTGAAPAATANPERGKKGLLKRIFG